MDIYRKELNEVYAAQHLESEDLPVEEVEQVTLRAQSWAEMGGGTTVITDAGRDQCYIFGGSLGKMMGFFHFPNESRKERSSDEDIIYIRIHPEDLVDKRLLEYEFFKFVDKCPEELKCDFKATCRIKMKDAEENYRYIDNSTRLVKLSPKGKIWLILCCYDYSPDQNLEEGIAPCIVDMKSGQVEKLNFRNRRTQILSEREKEILRFIREGLPSKLIADRMHISVHTVNRHRQNIISKLSVGNSIEAVMAAQMMNLL